jgi:hypothetical protein
MRRCIQQSSYVADCTYMIRLHLLSDMLIDIS